MITLGSPLTFTLAEHGPFNCTRDIVLRSTDGTEKGTPQFTASDSSETTAASHK